MAVREQYPLGAWVVWPVGEPEAAIYTDSIIRRDWVYWRGVLRGRVMAEGFNLLAGVGSDNAASAAQWLEAKIVKTETELAPPATDEEEHWLVKRGYTVRRRCHWRVYATQTYTSDNLVYFPQYKRRFGWRNPPAPDGRFGWLGFESDDECRDFIRHFEPLSFTPSGEAQVSGVRLQPKPKRKNGGCSPAAILGAAIILGS